MLLFILHTIERKNSANLTLAEFKDINFSENYKINLTKYAYCIALTISVNSSVVTDFSTIFILDFIESSTTLS